MLGKRPVIAASMALSMVYAIWLVWWGQGPGDPDRALILGVAPGGLVLAAMIGRLAQRRFFDDQIIDGAPFLPGSPAEIDQRVLANTTEQVLLALCLWPFAGWVLGWGLVPVLGVSFAVARLLFWIGYHLSPPLRGLGFAASFYPTLIAALWALAASL